MTVEEARKILGKRIEKLSDIEVIELMHDTAIICDELINMYLKKSKIKKVIN